NVVEPLVADGYQWLASGEAVLALALKQPPFKRDAQGLLQNADVPYRPYAVHANDGRGHDVVVRDDTLSALIPSAYGTLAPDAAASDLVNRLRAIKAELKKEKADGPHLVTVVLDRESTWQNYPDGGAASSRALYQRLTE